MASYLTGFNTVGKLGQIFNLEVSPWNQLISYFVLHVVLNLLLKTANEALYS